MNIAEEYEFRKSLEQEHSKTSLSPGEAGMLVMQHDPDFHRRWTHYQAYKVDPGPTVVHKQAPPSYEAILQRVTETAEKEHVARDIAFATMLKSAEGTPDFPALHAHYRQYHLTDGIADRDKATLAKDEPQIFSTAAALNHPAGVVSYVESLVRQMALTLEVSDEEVMQRLRAKYPGLHAAYVEAKSAIPALPAGAPTSVDSLKMVRR